MANRDVNDVGVTPAPSLRHDLGWFVAWLLAGTACAVTVLGAMTIGIFVLPIALAGIVVLVRRHGSYAGAPGVVSGAGLPLLYVAYLNRSGPGEVCTITTRSTSCTDELNPWPWLAAGLLLVVVGIVLFGVGRARRSARRS